MLSVLLMLLLLRLLLLRLLLRLLLLRLLLLLLLLVRIRGGNSPIHCQEIGLGEAQFVNGKCVFSNREKA